MVLSCVVVFITTYALILPAITLEQDEAAKQGGIDVPAQSVSDTDKGFEITADFDKAGLPEDVELSAEEITGSDQDYEVLYEDALQAVREDSGNKTSDLAFAKFYDISLYSDGERIEPDGPVDVTISYDKALKVSDADNLRIVHFALDEETGEVTPEVLDQKQVSAEIKNDKMTAATFEAASFSVYAVVYTVDFSYEVNGKTYSYSMQGADTVSLRSLVETLHIYEQSADNKALDQFMDDIESVTSSDESLLVPAKVEENTTAGKIKSGLKLFPTYPLGLSESEVLALNAKKYAAGDWILISMKPFDTEETLTVTLKTGDSFEIKVTDAQDAQMIGDQVLTVSNPAGTTIDLFDYWIVSQDLVGRDGWGDLNQGIGGGNFPDGSLNGTGNNKGINEDHTLKFSPAWESTVFNGTKDGGTSNNRDGRNGLNSYTGNANPFPGIVEGTLTEGYPVLTDNETIGSDGESLAYLFDPSVSHAGKASYPSVDQLLYVDTNGYYTYDSRDYRADYSGGTFTLTEQVSDDSEIRGFWPFGTQNFWTGMHINTQFSMPTDGQVLNPKGVYKDMQFEFSGDDDTWLYVDGVLVGDAGGIHNRSEIDVNFAKGTVTVTGKKGGGHSGDYEETKYLDDLFIAAGKYNEGDWEDIGDGSGHKRFKAGTYHIFDMFYLERGGGESNLYIHYNLISTADFTAHKSYEGFDNDDTLQRNQFRFELIGLDGKYRSVWSDDADDYVLFQEDTTSNAIMPHASSSGAGTTVSPYYNGETVTELSDGSSVGSQTYITGNVEDGNVNFGTAEISEQDMHDCDTGNPPVYRYLVREVVPDDAVNANNVTWADATPEQRAAGGFVKDSIIYDGTVYYMAARVTKWTETNASGQEIIRYGLSKTYYTDDTYTDKKPNTSFVDFRNRYTPDTADFEFDKVNANREPVEGAVFQLFRDSACKIPAKDNNNNTITATSNGSGKVSFADTRTGIYFMKEISVPEPYEVSNTVYRVKISKQGSSMSVNADQDNNPVTEVINIKPDDITVIKKWFDAEGKEVSGEGYPATVQLRRYHYVRTGPAPETHNVTLHFHFPDAGWNVPDKDFGPYEITGNSVVIHWKVNGCQFYYDQDYSDSQRITDQNDDNLLQMPLTSDIELDIYGNRDWASSNLNTVSVDGAFDDSKELRQDDSFPSEEEAASATQTLTSSSYMHAWSLGAGAEYDFPVGDELGDYLYYVVELDDEGNAVEPGDEATNGMTLRSIEYNPAKIEGLGITHGTITVKNELPRLQSTNVIIKKTDNADNSTNYLAGAVFKLEYRADNSGTFTNVSNTDVPQLDANSQFTVPTAGITLTGLVDGQYRLQEITPPEGYVITNDYPVVFTVSNGTITGKEGTISEVRYTAASKDQNALFIIPNTPGTELPEAGGPGTTWIYLIGSLLLLGCGIALVTRRRMRV